MIYLIDDDISVTRGLESFFKSADLKSKSFQSVDDFLFIYKPSESDIIILDLVLSGSGGCDLLKNFDSRGIKVPVIVVTASDNPQDAKRCKKYNVKAYLRKPVDAEALLDIVNFNKIL